MASIAAPSAANEAAWNEAYDRLVTYLRTFDLDDHAYVATVAVGLLNEAKSKHAAEPGRDPVALTLELAHQKIAEWLAANLPPTDPAPSKVLPAGYVAILLSRAYQHAPRSFLASPVPEEMRQALRETLIVTGPDLNVSSMTPRHLDYGPMLEVARQTWHRVDVKEFAIAVAFWIAVYWVFYWWLSQTV